MRKLLIPLSLMILVFSSCLKKLAQSKIADPKDSELFLKKDLTGDIISQLKATTTVFFYKKDQTAQLDSLKQAVQEGWTLTPVVFDDIDNFDKYASDPKFSYFIIEGYTTTTTEMPGQYSSGMTYSNTHYYLTLRLFKDVSKKGVVNTTGLCRIELYPNMQTMAAGEYGKGAAVINKLYLKGVFYNWTPILIKAQLENVATNLKNNIRPWLFEAVKDDGLSETLSEDTLYVPKSLLMDFNAWNGKEKDKKEDIFAKYKYNYRICTDKELFDIFETRKKKGRLLFEYVKSSTDKFVTVYDLKTKCIIYKEYTPTSYNLKSKDIERLNGKD